MKGGFHLVNKNNLAIQKSQKVAEEYKESLNQAGHTSFFSKVYPSKALSFSSYHCFKELLCILGIILQ